MKKINILFISLISCLLLVACTEEKTVTIIDDKNIDEKTITEEKVEDTLEYVAKESDLNTGFSNKAGQIIIFNEKDGLTIMGAPQKAVMGIETDLDKVFAFERVFEGQSGINPLNYPKAKVETKDSTYTITINDEITLTFEKVGLRIIKDSLGNEYTTSQYPLED